MADLHKRNENYSESKHAVNQVRDCVSGSNRVKRRNAIYLPIPSGMIDAPATMSSIEYSRDMGFNADLRDMPWYHPNPAYMSYLQRARFPDITGSILRGIVGIITKIDPELKLSNAVSHFEKSATVCQKNLEELYSYSISEVMQTGRVCFVLDVNENTGKLIIAVYSTERCIDWDYSKVDGEDVLTRVAFIEEYDHDGEGEEVVEYNLVNGLVETQKYVDGKEDGDPIPVMYKGKIATRIPVVFSCADNNRADVNIIPLLGVSDIALTIYRKDADLSQAQYMTCNPTLFIFGIGNDEKPSIIGSTVTVCMSNPNGKAEYPKTDTSALDNVKETIGDLFSEAISTGAQILGVGGKSAESAEALSIREAASGATLITTVDNVSQAIMDILEYADDWAGTSGSEFHGSLDFADSSLSAQDITAIVSSWLQGAISHDTVLDNLRAANIIDGEVTNKQEKDKIKKEQEDLTVVDDIDNLDDDE